MREIKFRAFGGYPLTMFEVATIMYKEDGKIDYLLDFDGRQFKQTIPVMQYTGLKDKNGKEIYEVDILKPTTDEGLWSDQVGKLHIVKDIRHPFGNCHLFEIIGNIYENPELVELKGE